MAINNNGKIFKAVGAQAVFTEQRDLRQYLTGLSTSFGYVLTDKHGTTFYTDPRYIETATKLLTPTGIKVNLFEGSLEKILKKYSEIAIPVSRTYYEECLKFGEMKLKIIDSTPAFETAMAVKEDEELDLIKKACRITDEAFSELLGKIKEGMSENEVAAELEYLMRKMGASGTSFETIVAFGENSSVPHHETGFRKLKFGDIILIDFGCKYGGYCSDCTRTFLFGDNGMHGEFKEAYSHVLNAHMLAKEHIVDGMRGRQADALARDYLCNVGLGKYFTHTLGHGVGINIHERPYISPKSCEVLQNNMVFSDEPGVYFEGKFGIRIEDTVTLCDGHVVSLTDSDKNLIVL